MQAIRFQISDWLWLVVAGFGFAFVVVGPEFAINYSESIPQGVYLVHPGHPQEGDYTFLKSDSLLRVAHKRGYIPRNTFMGKRIVASHGDSVIIRDTGVTINSKIYPNSLPLEQDMAGNNMPRLRGLFVLSKYELFVLGDHPRSFDSRYFGPVSREDVFCILKPFFTIK